MNWRQKVTETVPSGVSHMVPPLFRPRNTEEVPDLVFDIGTANAKMTAVGYEGVLIKPTAVLRETTNGKRIVVVGEEAYIREGREPEGFKVKRPVRGGQLDDPENFLAVSLALTREGCPDYFARAKTNNKRHTVAFCVAYTMTMPQLEELREMIEDEFHAIPRIFGQPDAAGIGSGLTFSEAPTAGFIDIGGGTTDLGIIQIWGEGGYVMSRPPLSLPFGGDRFTHAIRLGFEKMYPGNKIGLQTAETLKHELAAAMERPGGGTRKVKLRGDLLVPVTSEDVRGWITPELNMIVSRLNSVLLDLDREAPEISADLRKSKFLVGGGGSKIARIGDYFTQGLGYKVESMPSDLDPLVVVVVGGRKILENPDLTRLFDRTPPRRRLDPKSKASQIDLKHRHL